MRLLRVIATVGRHWFGVKSGSCGLTHCVQAYTSSAAGVVLIASSGASSWAHHGSDWGIRYEAEAQVHEGTRGREMEST
jgi:pyruvoyl-dependent arginine decarboxylase (PvlArgDC)